MSSSAYCSLIDDFCDLVMLPKQPAFYELANVLVRNVEINLAHHNGEGKGEVLIYCVFGPLAHDREQAMQRMLEINFYLFSGPYSPSLSYNPESERAVLTSYAVVEALTARQLLALLSKLANLALAWREGAFLGAALPASVKGRTAANSFTKVSL